LLTALDPRERPELDAGEPLYTLRDLPGLWREH
jgi:hypothetical protein